MTEPPNILFYCQHSLGMGHLVRSFALAGTLTESFDVTFLNGGPLPRGMVPPKGVNIINLPPLGTDGPDGMLISRDPIYSVEKALKIRRRMILAMLEKKRPSILLIELFPFGRKKFREELIPLLEAAKNQTPAPPKVICSLRDILVDRGGEKQVKHDDRARDLLHLYFDAVLVHTDPNFARLEESFKPTYPMKIPVHYTGFVVPPEKQKVRGHIPHEIVVSAGGGLVGGPLFRAALDAQGELWERDKMGMTLITGPFLPTSDAEVLHSQARERKGLEILRFVPNLCGIIGTAKVSVSQFGYNTAMDVLRSGIPSLVVPYEEGTQSEQWDRAKRLDKLGAIRLLRQKNLKGGALAREIRTLLKFKPKPTQLNLSGARNTLRILEEMVFTAPTYIHSSVP
ncbi:MAG: glycosyltransferase family protein [Nitrospinaceae bacterium]